MKKTVRQKIMFSNRSIQSYTGMTPPNLEWPTIKNFKELNTAKHN